MNQVQSAPKAAAQSKDAESDAAPSTENKSSNKRRYSKRWKSIQRVERGATKAAHRLTKAVTAGVDVWMKERDKSGNHRRDGGVKDARKNLRKAIRKTVREASEAPADVFDALSRVRLPKGLGLGHRWF